DLFVIRQLSPAITLGGGQIVDPLPARRHRRRQPAEVAALERLARGTPEEMVLQTVQSKEPAEPAAVLQASGLEAASARAALERLIERGEVVSLGSALVSASGWRRIEERF